MAVVNEVWKSQSPDPQGDWDAGPPGPTSFFGAPGTASNIYATYWVCTGWKFGVSVDLHNGTGPGYDLYVRAKGNVCQSMVSTAADSYDINIVCDFDPFVWEYHSGSSPTFGNGKPIYGYLYDGNARYLVCDDNANPPGSGGQAAGSGEHKWFGSFDTGWVRFYDNFTSWGQDICFHIGGGSYYISQSVYPGHGIDVGSTPAVCWVGGITEPVYFSGAVRNTAGVLQSCNRGGNAGRWNRRSSGLYVLHNQGSESNTVATANTQSKTFLRNTAGKLVVSPKIGNGA